MLAAIDLTASEVCERFWAKVPGIYIRLERLEEYDNGQRSMPQRAWVERGG